MLLSRSTSRRMRPTFFSTTGSSRTRKRRSCAADEMPKSGLRSSCATPADTSPIASSRRFCPSRWTTRARSTAAAVWAAMVSSTRRDSSMRCAGIGAQVNVIAPSTPSPLVIGAVISTPSADARVTTCPQSKRLVPGWGEARGDRFRRRLGEARRGARQRSASVSPSASAMATASQAMRASQLLRRLRETRGRR